MVHARMILSPYKRLEIFRDIVEEQKQGVILASAYNNALSRTHDQDERLQLIQSLDDNGQLQNAYDGARFAVREDTWAKDILIAYNHFLSRSDNELQATQILNTWLAGQGLCPLLRYAFSQWQPMQIESDVANIAELSPVYLYKLVPYASEHLVVSDSRHELLAQGSYGTVYLSPDRKTVFKVPSNLAAKAFMNDWEAEVYRQTQDTGLQPFMANLISYDDATATLEKTYIPGTTGWLLLEDDDFRRNPYALDQLKTIYDEANALYQEKGINIDIHPGNFQYNPDEKRWYLIDCGAMPKIGSDYYPRGDFDAYFKKIWMDLRDLMVEVPIRSVDINYPNAAASRIPTQPVFFMK